MARYVWVVKAYSPRDGGWVRWFKGFDNEREAWEAVEMFWSLAVLSGDYETVDIVKTIAFH